MTPDKEESPPPSEGPSENVVSGNAHRPTTASTSENSTGVIPGARADTPPPILIHSELSLVILVSAADERLHGATLRTLINLCGRANKRRECFPSQARIAAETSIHLRSVSRAIRQLKGFGYLKVTARGWHSNWYTITVPDDLPETHPYAHWYATGVVSGTPLVSWGYDTGVVSSDATYVVLNSTKELPPPNSSKEVPRDFVEDEDQERSEEEKRESNGKSQDLTGFWFRGEWRPYGKQPTGQG